MEESPIDILPLQFILRIWSGMSPLLHRHSVITSTIVCSIHFFVYIFSFQLLSASPAPSVLFPFIFPFLFPFSFSFIFPLLSSLILIHIVSVVITIIGNSSNIDINFLSREGKFLIEAIPFITFNFRIGWHVTELHSCLEHERLCSRLAISLGIDRKNGLSKSGYVQREKIVNQIDRALRVHSPIQKWL